MAKEYFLLYRIKKSVILLPGGLEALKAKAKELREKNIQYMLFDKKDMEKVRGKLHEARLTKKVVQ